MEETIEKAMNFGLGVLFLTKEKLEEVFNDVQGKHSSGIASGKEMANKVFEKAKEHGAFLETYVSKALNTAGVATKQDIEDLKAEIRKLQKNK